MDGSLKYPAWQKLLADAILEFDPRQLPAKAKIAEDAISGRFQELGSEEADQEEIRLLYDALGILRSLTADRLAK